MKIENGAANSDSIDLVKLQAGAAYRILDTRDGTTSSSLYIKTDEREGAGARCKVVNLKCGTLVTHAIGMKVVRVNAVINTGEGVA